MDLSKCTLIQPVILWVCQCTIRCLKKTATVPSHAWISGRFCQKQNEQKQVMVILAGRQSKQAINGPFSSFIGLFTLELGRVPYAGTALGLRIQRVDVASVKVFITKHAPQFYKQNNFNHSSHLKKINEWKSCVTGKRVHFISVNLSYLSQQQSCDVLEGQQK